MPEREENSSSLIHIATTVVFLQRLFALTQHPIELRALPSANRLFSRQPEAIEGFLNANSSQDLYFGVATRDGNGRGRKENCCEVPALWADLDFKETPENVFFELLRNTDLLPSVTVFSGGGLHLYWLLSPVAEAQDPRVENALKALAAQFQADRAAAEVARVLRLPGTKNHKPQYAPQQPEVAIRWEHWDRLYKLSDFEVLTAEQHNFSAPSTNPPAVINEGERHRFLLRAAGQMRARGKSAEEIEIELLQLNAKCCSPPSPTDEVKKIAADIGAKPIRDVTEDGVALTLVDTYQNQLRYTAPWRKWHRWNGAQWAEDRTVKIYDLARSVCRDAAEGNSKLKKVLKAGHTIASVVNLASTDQRIVMVPENWDQDKWLLNTPGGLVDLHTGELKTHDQTALITKITEVGPAGDCPIWRRQLDLVTAGDRALQEYLQRWAGYSLTGSINEEALAFFYGTGRNGKDTFVTTLQLILGDYARLAPIKTFTVSKNDQHPTDLAGLRGARLVVASETSGGSRWDEERIKLLTGGGKVSARFMRADFFDYMPEYKLWIMGNHKPSLRHVDVAMRRRLQLVPFTLQITPVDKNFKASLRPEWPGILQWAIQGCLEWQHRGLDPPAAVIEATAEYFADQDTLGRWLSEKCNLDPNAETLSTDAYTDWKIWTEQVKEYTGSQRNFSQKLTEKGFKKKKDGSGKMVFIGFELKT